MPKKNFNLDNNFYRQDCIQESLEAFSDFSIKIIPIGVEIEDDDPQKVFDEFSNYCIAISNETLV